MNLNTSSVAGTGAINLKIAGAGAWSILDQLSSLGRVTDLFLVSFLKNQRSMWLNPNFLSGYYFLITLGA